MICGHFELIPFEKVRIFGFPDLLNVFVSSSLPWKTKKRLPDKEQEMNSFVASQRWWDPKAKQYSSDLHLEATLGFDSASS